MINYNTLEQAIRAALDENERMHDYAISTETVRCIIDNYNESKQNKQAICNHPSNFIESTFGGDSVCMRCHTFNPFVDKK